jgi:murein DD-endopeptidase MepM/ murein hydrolase activator NlpD
VRDETRQRARTFGLGALCGFLAGAALVGVVVSKYGAPAGSTAPTLHRPPAVRADDGMADVDEPVLVAGARTPQAAPEPAPPRATPSPNADPAAPAPGPASSSEADELKRRGLAIPVEGVKSEQLVESFSDERSGTRVHEALDILAPRNTPVKAVEDGTIARLFFSKAGGITIYQFDPTEQFCYYYAHLERYADGLQEGDHVTKGQLLGYVGTSGNAPKNTPHLHFAVFRLTAAKHWWEGTPIDPYTVLR